MVKATVVIPTFDHFDMITRAIASLKKQTIQSYEVFVIGDGVPDKTRELMTCICHEDNRFHFFDNPKSPRTGEVYRHTALQKAKGKIVCYLADDDLWLPNHLEIMLEAGKQADFFHSLNVGIDPKAGVYFIPSNLENRTVRDLLCHTAANRFGLSFGGHTLAAYRSLPYGWRSTPVGLFTDLYMWQQFLMSPKIRAITIFQITALQFPSPLRRGWNHQQRLDELDHWLRISDDNDFPAKLGGALIAHAARNFAVLDMFAGLGRLAVIQKSKISSQAETRG